MPPYFFVIAVEYLCRSLASIPGDFKFQKGCKEIKLNYLHFADDLFIFYNGDRNSIAWIKQTLNHFYEVSRLQVNEKRSFIYFSGGFVDNKSEILHIIGFQSGELPMKYLGISLFSTRLKKDYFYKLIDKITCRISGWVLKYLSFVGRLQLILLVLKSMQIYWCSVFLLPKSVLKEIDAKCINYWWKGNDGKGKGPVACKDIRLPYEEGGLGIKDLKSWNMAIGK